MDVDVDEAASMVVEDVAATKVVEDVVATKVAEEVVVMVTEALLTRTVALLMASALNLLVPGVAVEASDVEVPVAAAKVAVDVVGIRLTKWKG